MSNGLFASLVKPKEDIIIIIGNFGNVNEGKLGVSFHEIIN